jgi:hypothetical protein
MKILRGLANAVACAIFLAGMGYYSLVNSTADGTSGRIVDGFGRPLRVASFSFLNARTDELWVGFQEAVVDLLTLILALLLAFGLAALGSAQATRVKTWLLTSVLAASALTGLGLITASSVVKGRASLGAVTTIDATNDDTWQRTVLPMTAGLKPGTKELQQFQRGMFWIALAGDEVILPYYYGEKDLASMPTHWDMDLKRLAGMDREQIMRAAEDLPQEVSEILDKIVADRTHIVPVSESR